MTTQDIQSQNIGSAISSEMRTQSVVAVVIAAFFMLLYIWFRFKDIRFAGSAILALVHDVLCVLTLYVLARISVGGTFIACMLTIIGYSINDTIVTFDRIRENRKRWSRRRRSLKDPGGRQHYPDADPNDQYIFDDGGHGYLPVDLWRFQYPRFRAASDGGYYCWNLFLHLPGFRHVVYDACACAEEGGGRGIEGKNAGGKNSGADRNKKKGKRKK